MIYHGVMWPDTRRQPLFVLEFANVVLVGLWVTDRREWPKDNEVILYMKPV